MKKKRMRWESGFTAKGPGKKTGKGGKIDEDRNSCWTKGRKEIDCVYLLYC